MKSLYNLSTILCSVAVVLAAGIVGTSISQKDVTPLDAAGGTGLDGWILAVDTGAGASASLTSDEGFIEIDVTNSGSEGFHVKFVKEDNSLSKGDRYNLMMRVKASKDIKANFIVNNKPDWNPMDGEWGLSIGTSFADHSLDFEAFANESDVDYLFEFGNGWTENTGAYVLTIEKIILTPYEATAQYFDDFSDGTVDSWTTTYDSPAAASISVVGQALQMDITSYYGNSEAWRIHLHDNTEYAVTSGLLYQVTFDVTVTNTQNFEMAVEDDRLDWKYRAGFNSGSWDSGSHSYQFTFTAEQSLSDVRIHLMLNQNISGITSNTLTIDNVALSTFIAGTPTEVRPGYYVSEFVSEVLDDAETCIADPLTGFGYMDVPDLYTNYYVKLIDSDNMATEMVDDYNYTAGEGSDPKTSDLINAQTKWEAMVAMYNANNGTDEDILLTSTIDASPKVFNSNFIWLIAGFITFSIASYYLVIKPRKRA